MEVTLTVAVLNRRKKVLTPRTRQVLGYLYNLVSPPNMPKCRCGNNLLLINEPDIKGLTIRKGLWYCIKDNKLFLKSAEEVR